MIQRAFRITQTKYLTTAFTGVGARNNGGRWNSLGTSMVYTASSISLATLEMLVHINDIAVIHSLYSVIPIEFKHDLVQEVNVASLPGDWDNPVINPLTQTLGDQWVAAMSSVLLKLPSAVTENESNYLINPAHSEFSKISIGKTSKFKPNKRLKPT